MAKQKANTINEFHLNKHEPQKPQFAIYDMDEYLQQHQAHASKPHIHSFYQIIWFKSGKGKHFVDFREYDVFDNAIFFIAKNQVHYFDHKTLYKGVMIHFNETFLMPNDSKVDFLLKCNLFNNPYQQPSCCVRRGNDNILEEYLRLIKDELRNEEEFGQEELLRTYLKAFLIQVQRKKNEFEKDGSNAAFALGEKRVQLIRFVNLVDENYNKGFSVAEYASLMHVSNRTLSDLTGQLLNKTPSQMIQERIILEAQRLLLHSNLNINQIGYRLGFDDPSYFVKYFKKHTKSSPSEFRKSVS
jgi:AraC family transcriptional activator of pobA